ncbi:MAG: sulfatase [Bryobacter sp.]|nr:sulfatase [Bryobacter sp.]
MNRRNFLMSAFGAAGMAYAQSGKRPNILFAIADDWSHRHASMYGHKWLNTPNIDRVAKEGVTFTNCFTSNPKCSPCRATILTGRNSWQTKEAVSHFSFFPNEFPVYTTLLEQSGYFVGLTGKGWGPGEFRSMGFAHNPAGKSWDQAKLKPKYKGINTNDYSTNFELFLKDRPANQPFCFWMGFTEPHRFYEEGSGLRAGKRLEDVQVAGYYPNHNTIKSDYLDYALEVESNDHHIGRALAALEQRGELDNTLVVVTSDHGMPFPRVKGQIYEEGFHLPLFARLPGVIKPGRTVDDFVNTRDFGPTFLDLAGLPKAGTMTGRSFLDLLRSEKSGWIDESRDVMLVGKERHDIGRPGDAGYPVRAIRTRQYLYVRNYHPERWPAGNPETGYRNVDDSPSKSFLLNTFDEYYKLSFGKRPPEELYDISKDPDCLKNLADDRTLLDTKRKLRERMELMLRQEEDPRMLGNEEFFDTIPYTGNSKHSWANWLKYQQ